MKFEKIVFPGRRVEIPGTAIIDPEFHWVINRPKKVTPKESEVLDNFLRGKPHCNICGNPMRMRDGKHRTHFVCRAKHEGRQCFLSSTVLENIALRCVKDTLDRHSYELEFQAAVRAEILEALSGFDASVKEWEEHYKAANRSYENALDALSIKTSEAVHADLAARADKALAQKESLLRSVEQAKSNRDRVSALLAEVHGKLLTMSEHLAKVAVTYPWKPSDPDEKKLRDDIRGMIKAVHVRTVDSSAVAVFDLILVKDEESDFEVVRRVELEEPDVLSKYDKTNKDRWLIADAFQASTAKLTDEEFASLPPFVLPQNVMDCLRLNIDIVLVAAELGLEPADIAHPIGKPDQVRPIRLLRQNAALESIIVHLRKTRGDQFDLPHPEPMAHGTEVVRLATMRDPVLLLSNCDPGSGKTRLDDDQWACIRDIFDRRRLAMNLRITIDAYFAIIRLRLPISMASRVGSTPNQVRRLTKPVYRRAMSEVVRRLLALEGFYVPLDYCRSGRVLGHVPTLPDFEAIIDQMRETMPRREPGLPPEQQSWFNSPGFRFGLTTHDAYDDEGSPIYISSIQRRLLACLLCAEGEVVSTDKLRTVILQAGGVGNVMSSVNYLRVKLRDVAPHLAQRLLCEKEVGYRIATI